MKYKAIYPFSFAIIPFLDIFSEVVRSQIWLGAPFVVWKFARKSC